MFLFRDLTHVFCTKKIQRCRIPLSPLINNFFTFKAIYKEFPESGSHGTYTDKDATRTAHLSSSS